MPPLRALGQLFGAPGSPDFDALPRAAEVRRRLDAGTPGNAAVTHPNAKEPWLRPVVLSHPPEQARARVLAAVATLRGWRLTGASDDVVWATRTTPMLGFVDDVLVLLTPAPGGTRIEAHSASRIGQNDFGRNRRTLRELTDVLRRWS